MTEQDRRYAAGSFERLLLSCLREKRFLRVLQAEADMSNESTTRRPESPQDILSRMRLRVKLHCTLPIAKTGAPSHRIRFWVKVGDKQVRVWFHHA